jgi:hypothetical protein
LNPPGVTIRRPSIRFSIKNFGPTPAIVTKIETHLYLAAGMATPDPPEPASPEALANVETSKWFIRAVDPPQLARSDMMSIDTSDDAQIRIMFMGGAESGLLEQTFVFNSYRPQLTQWAWFYCAITYQDIIGETRHTWFYAQAQGAGFSYPKTAKYNHWD